MLTHGSAEWRAPGRVVLVGGSGFIGGALGRALGDDGVEVVSLNSAAIDLTAADAGERLAATLAPGDAVVVLSALTPDRRRGLPAFLDNIAIGAAVCAAVEATEPDHVVYLSSDAVYPMTDGLVDEGTCADPPDLYGMMHRAREQMLEASTGAPLAVLRPTLVYGAADTHNSYGPNRLRRAAAETGRIELFGDGEEQRDHLYIDDVVALLRLVLGHRSAGLLNLATGSSVSYFDLAQRVANLFDPPAEVACTPRQNPITHRHFDVTALHRAFPTFTPTSLDDGLARAHDEMVRGA